MNKLCCLIVLFVACGVSFAQKQGNIWYFGNHAGLDFNSGIPVPLTNGQTYSPDGTPIEGTAVISDSSGALLFYTNGEKIWNNNHQIMPNGNGLLGGFSSTQSSLIVPQPGSSRYFYVFTTDAFHPNNLQHGFRYSIVDICLDGGLGDLIASQKNILILDTAAEKLTAVRHANGFDYWIIVHKYYSDAFYSYHLSSSGIIDTVISHIGSRHPDITAIQDSWAAIGELKASPDGTKLAIVNGNTGPHAISEYFDFDKNTGIVSNWINLQTTIDLLNNYQYYGISFSPDNSKLYITCWLNNNGVLQFNLNAGGGNADSVRASKTKIAGQTWCWGLQLGADGKIYVAGQNPYISVINNPNDLGANCNFVDSAIYLNGGVCSDGLPNFIDSYDYSNSIYYCATGINEQSQNETALVFPDPFHLELNIKTNVNELSEIILYDVTARKIFNQSFTNSTSINTGQLAKGIYIYEVRNKNGPDSYREIKKGKVVKE